MTLLSWAQLIGNLSIFVLVLIVAEFLMKRFGSDE